MCQAAGDGMILREEEAAAEATTAVAGDSQEVRLPCIVVVRFRFTHSDDD